MKSSVGTRSTVCAPRGRTVRGDQVLDPSTVRQVNYALVQNANEGTGRAAAWSEDRPVAGKTGTSQNNVDGWFAGFACGITTVVWVGHDGETQYPMIDFRKPREDGSIDTPKDEQGRYIDDRDWPNIEGGNMPTWIWKDYMQQATAAMPPCAPIEVETEFPGVRMNQERRHDHDPPAMRRRARPVRVPVRQQSGQLPVPQPDDLVGDHHELSGFDPATGLVAADHHPTATVDHAAADDTGDHRADDDTTSRRRPAATVGIGQRPRGAATPGQHPVPKQQRQWEWEWERQPGAAGGYATDDRAVCGPRAVGVAAQTRVPRRRALHSPPTARSARGSGVVAARGRDNTAGDSC